MESISTVTRREIKRAIRLSTTLAEPEVNDLYRKFRNIYNANFDNYTDFLINNAYFIDSERIPDFFLEVAMQCAIRKDGTIDDFVVSPDNTSITFTFIQNIFDGEVIKHDIIIYRRQRPRFPTVMEWIIHKKNHSSKSIGSEILAISQALHQRISSLEAELLP